MRTFKHTVPEPTHTPVRHEKKGWACPTCGTTLDRYEVRTLRCPRCEASLTWSVPDWVLAALSVVGLLSLLASFQPPRNVVYLAIGLLMGLLSSAISGARRLQTRTASAKER